MKPNGNPRIWRKGLREAKRGVPTGRRATHPIQTTYGHQQRDQDWRAAWTATRTEFATQKLSVHIGTAAHIWMESAAMPVASDDDAEA